MHCWIIEVRIKAGHQRPLREQQSDLGLGINWKIASGILDIPAHLFCAAHSTLHTRYTLQHFCTGPDPQDAYSGMQFHV